MLPTSPGAAKVTLDGVSITCHPEAGKLWRVMRRPLTAGSKTPGHALRFGTASEGSLVVTSDRTAVLCASNDLVSPIITQGFKVTVGDQVAIAARIRPPPDTPSPPEPQPQPPPVARFCYYAGAEDLVGPCRGAKCTPGCKPARVSVKMVKVPAGCSQVCACELAPRCLP